MIYICKLFSLPCTICNFACTNCREAFSQCCQGIGRACGSISDAIAPVTRGPLAAYVIGTWIMTSLIGLSFGKTLSEAKCPAARDFSCIVIGIAVMHAIFAFYVQRKLSGSLEQFQQMSHKEIADRTAHLLLYDIGVCFYIFFFFGSLAYLVYGVSEIGCNELDWTPIGLLVVYYVGVSNYFSCWMCTQFCCGAVEKRSKKGGAAPSSARTGDQQIMGVPVDQATPAGVVMPVGPGNV